MWLRMAVATLFLTLINTAQVSGQETKNAERCTPYKGRVVDADCKYVGRKSGKVMAGAPLPGETFAQWKKRDPAGYRKWYNKEMADLARQKAAVEEILEWNKKNERLERERRAAAKSKKKTMQQSRVDTSGTWFCQKRDGSGGNYGVYWMRNLPAFDPSTCYRVE